MYVGGMTEDFGEGDTNPLEIFGRAQEYKGVEVLHCPNYLFLALPALPKECTAMRVADSHFHGCLYTPISAVFYFAEHYTTQVCVPLGAWYTHNSLYFRTPLRLNTNGLYNEEYHPRNTRVIVYQKINWKDKFEKTFFVFTVLI